MTGDTVAREASAVDPVDDPVAGTAVDRTAEPLVAEAVLQAVARVLELAPAALGRQSQLVEDLHADSLALVEIAELIEERLGPVARPGFAIADEDLESLVTLGDVIDYATARL